MTTGAARQAWLDEAAKALSSLIAQRADVAVPPTTRISFGFPKGSHGRAKAIGQCWGSQASSDNHNEIFISPELGMARDATDAQKLVASCRALDVLAHELVHAAVGVEAGHKAPFKRAAVAIGLTGKMTATVATEEFNAWAVQLVEGLGFFPGGSLNPTAGRKKQTTRLLKCQCGECGYTARITKKWIAEAGVPDCPADGSPLEAPEGSDDGDDE